MPSQRRQPIKPLPVDPDDDYDRLDYAGHQYRNEQEYDDAIEVETRHARERARDAATREAIARDRARIIEDAKRRQYKLDQESVDYESRRDRLIKKHLNNSAAYNVKMPPDVQRALQELLNSRKTKTIQATVNRDEVDREIGRLRRETLDILCKKPHPKDIKDPLYYPQGGLIITVEDLFSMLPPHMSATLKK